MGTPRQSVSRVDKTSTQARSEVRRFDVGTIEQAQRTPQGGLRVPARPTRSGVFLYRRADGSIQREWRPPDEVFSRDSLSSLEDAPVTVDHPTRMVTPDTYKDVAVGHVRDMPRREGAFVAAELVVQDADAVEAIERRDLRELSCGYVCLLDMTPGTTPDGEAYDAVQRAITYNHVALGPEGWGRGGPDVSLRVDSDDAAQVGDQPKTPPAPPARQHRTDSMKTHRVDGVDYEVGSDAHLQALQRRDQRIEAELAEAKSKAEETQGRLDQANKDLEEAKKKLDEATSPERIDAAVAARVALVEGARRVLGEDAELDGLPDRKVMEQALAKVDSELKLDGRSDDYVRGMFEQAVKAAPEVSRRSDAGRLRTEAAFPAPPKKREGGDERRDAKSALAAMRERNAEAWRKPLSASKAS